MTVETATAITVHMTYTEEPETVYARKAATEDDAAAVMMDLAGFGTYVDYCDETQTFAVYLGESLIGTGYMS